MFAPLSEVYGRARPMFFGLFFFLILQAPIALAQNLPAIFICRFLTGAAGSSIIAIFPAMTVELFSSSARGPAVDLYVLAVYAVQLTQRGRLTQPQTERAVSTAFKAEKKGQKIVLLLPIGRLLDCGLKISPQ